MTADHYGHNAGKWRAQTPLNRDDATLRTLAGFSGTDPYEVHDTLPDALADCHTPIPDSDPAAAHAAFTKLARMHTDRTASEKRIIDKVTQILARTEYSRSVFSLSLGQLYRLDDEWEEGWGRTTQQLTTEVQQACAARLAACAPAAGPSRTR